MRREKRPALGVARYLAMGLLATVAWAGCTAVLGIDKNYRLEDDASSSGGMGGMGAGGIGPTTSAGGMGGDGGMGGMPLKSNGQSCDDASECSSMFCVDGVCCDSACDGPCEACSSALTDAGNGTCAPVTALTDPDDDCVDPEVCLADSMCGLCDIRPDAPGPMSPCPAVCNGGCTVDGMNNICNIDCSANQSCQNTTFTCPPNFTCEVDCSGNQSCSGTTFTCPDTYACLVSCTGNQACSQATLNCTTGVCDFNCASGQCGSTVVNCGTEACFASCNANQMPTLNCGAACNCTGC